MTTKFIALIPWALSLFVVGRIAYSWSQLPERIAVHFNASGEADRWAGKSAAVALIALAVFGHSALATWLFAGGHTGQSLVVFWLSQIFLSLALAIAFWQVTTFNLSGAALRPLWFLLPLALLVLVQVLGMIIPRSVL